MSVNFYTVRSTVMRHALVIPHYYILSVQPSTFHLGKVIHLTIGIFVLKFCAAIYSLTHSVIPLTSIY